MAKKTIEKILRHIGLRENGLRGAHRNAGNHDPSVGHLAHFPGFTCHEDSFQS